MAIAVTDSQDEQSLEELYRDVDQVHIPIFQREYVWNEKQLKDLCSDILLISEKLEDFQFLGAIVAYERKRLTDITGRMKVLDVVDGQQRLLTLHIFVLAIAERIFHYDQTEAKEIIQEFLLLAPRRGLTVNTRVVPSYEDRNQFRAIWDRINSPELMQELLRDNPPKAPLPSGKSTGKLDAQYGRIIAWLKKRTPKEPTEAVKYLRSTLDIITQKLTFVHLKLTDPSVATKIFERLNYRGIKVEIGDLVRNEVFARSEESTTTDMDLYQTVWRPFEVKFAKREESFYFPYCLIHNSNIKKSELFTELREIWQDYSPADIVKHMEPYQSVFLQIVTGEPTYNEKELNQQLTRFHRLRIPTAMYPFLMQVLRHMETGELQLGLCKNILEYIEAFVVRRAILGYEPTGLHALFKGLWNEVHPITSLTSLKAAIEKRHTIQNPTNREIKEALLVKPLAKAKICNYLLVEYDQYLPGDNPREVPTIEHILPQTYSDEWSISFTRDEHKVYKDVLANLIPLSTPLNSSLQASSYKSKSVRYKAESMYVTPRIIAEKWPIWNIEAIEERSNILYEWVINRWKE